MEQQNSSASFGNAAEAPQSVWRDEVQARVAGYRSRRGRRLEGAFSMRFPFPPAEAPSLPAQAEAACEAEASDPEQAGPAQMAAEPAASAALAPEAVEDLGANSPTDVETSGESDRESEAAKQKPRRARRNLIAFPKPAVEPPRRDDLPEQPRIFEVAEELPVPTTPLLDGLLFPSQQQADASASTDHIELPLQAVAMRQRLYAGALDCAMVGVATGIFAAAAYKLMPKFSPSKPLLLAAAGIPLLLWSAYQYLFLMYAGRTAGMQWAGIRLSSFKGGFPSRRQRRSRAISLYFSTASLMMGLLWALVDVDALCWHDRISRTYLTRSSS